ncbi:MAG: hypothetical protein HY843_07875 [Bdellovibrio sp.]|nr:hypothetical protein [Bdellovibrio sp.]
MSATRDKSQKFTFLYSNLYQIYRTGREQKLSRPQDRDNNAFVVSSPRVIKAEDFNQGKHEHLQIVKHNPVQFLSTPEIPHIQTANPLESLKKNLLELTELHERLQFMLHELEDLIKEE